MASMQKTFKLLYGNMNKTRKTAKTVKHGALKWGANFSRSVALSARDVVMNELTPNLVEFDKLNGEAIREMGATLANPGRLKTQLAQITESGTYAESKKLVSYIFDDIKTGNFYNPNRDRSNMGMETAALLDSFGGEDDYMGLSDSSGSDSDGFNSESENLADLRTASTNRTIGQGLSAVIQNEQAMHEHSIMVQQLHHNQSMAGMANIAQTQMATMSGFIDSQIKLMTPLIESSKSIESKMDILIAEVKNLGAPKEGPKKSSYKESPLEQIFGGKMPDVKAYGKMVGKNFDEVTGLSSALSMLMMGMRPEDFIDIFKSNPLEFVTKGLIRAIIPKGVKSSAGRFNKSLEGFFPSLIAAMNSYAANEDAGFWKKSFSKIFGKTISPDTQIRTDEYQQEQSELLQRIGKATTEVIPTYLADIASALTGRSSRIYDYKSGKFVKAKQVAYDTSRATNYIDNHLTETISNFERRIAMMEMGDSDKATLNKDLREYLRDKARSGRKLDLAGKYSDSGMSFTGGAQSYEIIKAITKSMARNEILNMNRELLLAPVSMNQSTKRVNDDLYKTGKIAAYNDYYGYDKEIRRGQRGELIDADDGVITRSSTIMNSKGLTKTNYLLEDILTTLRRGIVVYPVEGVGKGNGRKLAMNIASDSLASEKERIRREENEKEKRRERDRSSVNSAYNRSMESGAPFISSYGNMTQERLDVYFQDIDAKVRRDDKAAEDRKWESNETMKYLRANKYSKSIAKFFDGARNTLANPFVLVEKTFDFADKAMFKMIYGKDADIYFDEDGEPLKKIDSLIEMIGQGFASSIDRLTGWFEEKVFGPNGYLGKFLDVGRNFFREKVMNGMYNKGKDYLFNSETGKLTPYVNRAKGFIGSVGKGIGSFGNFKDAYRNYDTMDEIYGIDPDAKFNPMQRAGHKVGKAAAYAKRRIDSYLFGDDYMDENGEMRKTKSRETWEMVSKELKGFAPKGVAGAALGAGAVAGAGLISGLFLPGGPLLGAIIGSTVNLVSHSEKLREYLFGNEEKGVKGKIDKEVVDGFKKYAPKIAIGTLAGATWANFGILGGSLMPFGPIGGALIGSMAGMVAANEDLKKMMFGDGIDPETGLISKNFRKKALDKLIDIGVGAGGGMAAGAFLSQFGILGSLIMPGGPVTGAILGGLAGAFSQTSIRQYFFGETDKDGEKVKVGVFDRLFSFGKKEYFDPFLGWLNDSGKKIGTWFKESIVDEFSKGLIGNKNLLKTAGEKMSEAFGNFGTYLKDGINNVFDKHMGAPLGELFKENVSDPFKKMLGYVFNGLGRILGGVLSSPFKLFGAIGQAARGDVSTAELFLDRRKERAARKLKAKERKAAIKQWFKGRWAAAGVTASKGIGFMGWDKMAQMSESDFIKATSDIDFTKSGNDYTAPIGPMPEWSDSDDTNPGFFQKLRAAREELHQDRLRRSKERAQARHDKRMLAADAGKRELDLDREKHDQMMRNRADKSRVDVEFDDASKGSMKHTDFVLSNQFKKSFLRMTGYLGDIRDEVKGQLGGVGYNLAHIKNILSSNWGKKEDVPDGVERKDYRRDGIMGRLGRFGRGVGRKVRNLKDAAVDKIYDTFDYFFGPGSMIGRVFYGFGNMFGFLKDVGKDVLGGFRDIAFGVGSAVKEFGINLAAGIGEGLGSMVAAIGNSIEALTGAIAGFSQHIGDMIGSLGSMMMHGMQTMTSFMSNGLQFLFETGGYIGGKLVKGAAQGAFGMAKMAGNAALGAGEMLWDWMKAKREKRKYEKRDKFRNIGTFQISGGTIDEVGSIKFPTSGGMLSQELELVSLFKGRVIGKLPDHAIPVYVVGGDINARNKPMSNAEKKKYGKDFSQTIDSVSDEKDLDKVLQDMAANGADPAEIAHIQTAILKNIADGKPVSKTEEGGGKEGGLLKDLLGGAGLGGALLKGGGVLAAALALLKGFGPLVGSVMAATRGDYDRVGINIAKMSPSLRRMIDAPFTRFMDGFKNNKLVSELLQEAPGTKLGFARTLGYKAGQGMSYMSDKFSSAKRFISAPFEKAFKPIATGYKYGGVLKEIGSSSKKAFGTRIGAGEWIGATAKQATESISKVKSGLMSMVTNSKVLAQIGGTKMGAGVKAFIEQVATKLASQNLSKSMMAKIIAKCTPANLVFVLYDLSTGMMEAANIFQVSGTNITWKMRIAAGLAKVVSGLTFGVVSDNWLAQLAYGTIATEDEMNDFRTGKANLEAEANAYNLANGTSYTVDQFNDKVKNKRVFSKVWDGAKAAGGAVVAGAKAVINPVSAIAGTVKGFLSSNILKAGDIGSASLIAMTNLSQVMAAGFAGLLEHATSGSISSGTLGMITSTFQQSLPASSGVSLGKNIYSADFGKSIGGGALGLRAPGETMVPKSVSARILSEPATYQVDPRAKVIDGMYYFNQRDPWAASTGTYNMEKSGCGPTSAAMVLSSYGKNVNPQTAANHMISGGFAASDGGTNPKFFPYVGGKYGVKFRIGTKSKSAIVAELLANRPVILMGKKSNAVSPSLRGGPRAVSGYNVARRNSQPATMQDVQNTMKYGSASPFGDTMHYVVGNLYNPKTDQISILDPDNIKSGKYVLSNIMKDVVTVIFSSTQTGKGINRDKIMKKESATLKAAGSMVQGDQYYPAPDDPSMAGMDMATEVNTNPMDIYSFINKIGTALSSAADIRFGLTTFDDALSAFFGGGDQYGGQYGNSFVPKSTREKILKKVYELTVANEGAYNSVRNDINASTKQTIGPSVGILQWHGGRIGALMSRLAPKLANDPATSKYLNYPWASDKPWSKSELDDFSKYLTRNKDVVMAVQQQMAMDDINNTNLAPVYNYGVNTGKISDPRAIAFLADFANTGPNHVKSFLDKYQPTTNSANEFGHFIKEFKAKSYWGDKQIYQNRINKTAAALNGWDGAFHSYEAGDRTGAMFGGSPWVKGDIDVHDWFGQRLSALGQSKGQPVYITSGYRSIQEQTAIVNKNLQKPGYKRSPSGGVIDARGNSVVAAPGNSRHQVGLAADLAGWAQRLSNKELAPFGLWKPMGYEQWHVEPIETKSGMRSVPTNQLLAKYGIPSNMTNRYVAANDTGLYGQGSGAVSVTPMTMDNNIRKLSSRLEASRASAGLTGVAELRTMQQAIKTSATSSSDTKLVEMMALLTKSLGVMIEELAQIRENTGNMRSNIVVANRSVTTTPTRNDVPTVVHREVDSGRREILDDLVGA